MDSWIECLQKHLSNMKHVPREIWEKHISSSQNPFDNIESKQSPPLPKISYGEKRKGRISGDDTMHGNSKITDNQGYTNIITHKYKKARMLDPSPPPDTGGARSSTDVCPNAPPFDPQNW